MPDASAAPERERRRDAARAAAAVGLVAVAVALAAAMGEPAGAGDSIRARWATVLMTAVTAGAPAGAYLLGALGLGRVLSWLWRGGGTSWALQLGAGLALMLTVSHAMGWAGLLGLGPLVAGAPVVLGLALLAGPLLHGHVVERARVPVTGALLAAVPGAAILIVAACSPPGSLWGSEFGGYDALSYHLQLPREWLMHGRLEPLEHNVYSFLPGYVEAAYMHVGALLGGGPGPGGDIAAGSGTALLASQWLHAGIAVCAALLCGRAAMAASARCGLRGPSQRTAGGGAFAIVLLTPWTVVTGSLAYNEHAMLALGAAATVAAMQPGVSAWRRGALAGLLVGAACGAKPTALLFMGVPTGIVLLGFAPVRRWGALVGAGTVAGAAALSPWLVRNAMAGGNPVFPYATAVFGSAHWSAEQVETFGRGHHFAGTAADRVRLLVLPDESERAGSPNRGMLHQQWGAFFPMVAGAAVAGVTWKVTRRVSLLLSAGLAAQVVLWLWATHIQSRFLMPMLVHGSAVLGLAAGAAIERWPRQAWIGAGLACAGAAVQAGFLIVVFHSQHHGRPNRLLTTGVAGLNGAAYRDAFASATGEQRTAFLADATPEVFVNLGLPPDMVVYLLGDGTPLHFRPPLLHHTTWDRSPLGEAMRHHPGEPAAWSAELQSRGVGFVLLNLAELHRLRSSGWYDPLVTPQTAGDWLEEAGVRLREWPLQGRVLYQLRPVLRSRGRPAEVAP